MRKWELQYRVPGESEWRRYGVSLLINSKAEFQSKTERLRKEAPSYEFRIVPRK